MTALLSSGRMSMNPSAMSTTTPPPLMANGSYELYEGPTARQHTYYHQGVQSSLEEEHLSPPGGPALLSHPPGSPKPMQLKMTRSREEAGRMKEIHQFENDPSCSCGDVAKESSVGDDMKDATIRHLQRQVTILQADRHKKEGLEKRMIQLTEEKGESDDRLRKLIKEQEHLVQRIREQDMINRKLKEENEHLKSMRQSSSGAYDSSSSLSSPSDQTYCQELESLHKMVDMLKTTVLEQRKVFHKMGLTNGSFSGVQSSQQRNLASVTAQNTQQPNRLVTTASLVNSVSNNPSNVAFTNGNTPTSSASMSQPSSVLKMTARPVRQAEESCEGMQTLPSLYDNNVALKVHSAASRGNSKERTSPSAARPSDAHDGFSAEAVADDNANHLPTSAVSSAAALSGTMEYNQHQSPSHILASGSGSPRRSRPGSVSSELKPVANPASQISVPTKAWSASTSDDMDVFNPLPEQASARTVPSGQRASPSSPAVRKLSQSAIIDRRSELIEGAPLPTKSRTEIIGNGLTRSTPSSQNSHLLHQQHQQFRPQQQHLTAMSNGLHQQQQFQTPSDSVRLQYPPGFAATSPSPVGTTLTTSTNPSAMNMNNGTQFGTGVVAGGIAARMPTVGIPGGCPSRPPLENTTAWRPPFEAEGCVISPVPSSYGNTLSNISEFRSSSNCSSPPQPPPRQQGDNNNSSGSSNNRLCPVCNQDFSHISMDDFQTHVFDCFDNDSGPETLQPQAAMDYPLQQAVQGLPTQQSRTCPMCQQKFPLATTQAEFEQHVHRHFGEEAFEEL